MDAYILDKIWSHLSDSSVQWAIGIAATVAGTATVLAWKGIRALWAWLVLGILAKAEAPMKKHEEEALAIRQRNAERFTSIEERMIGLQEDVAEVKGDVKDIGKAVAGHGEQLAAVNTNLTNINDALRDIRQTIGKNGYGKQS